MRNIVKPLTTAIYLISAAAALFAQPQQRLALCDELKLGLPPDTSSEVRAALDRIGNEIELPTFRVRLQQSESALINAEGGAAATLCNGNQQYIFYSPSRIEQLKRSLPGTGLPLYFILSHEFAHHKLDHLLDNTDPVKDQEGEADWQAARWLTRIDGVTYDGLIAAFNSLQLKEAGDATHPSTCERRGKITEGYNLAAPKRGLVAATPVTCNVCLGYLSTSRALLLRHEIDGGKRLQPDDFVACGISKIEDLPLDYNSELAGMCVISKLSVAARLTWKNVDVCSLMH
ncbi:MAG: hypothetical protein JO307_13085 [Bryobacterales bacterium]|nr:hypothetical protein [Bryobacterales bacterium]MBV9399175.1 hypothetical protein [Bryobacterales bacterium]